MQHEYRMTVPNIMLTTKVACYLHNGEDKLIPYHYRLHEE